MTNTSTVNLKTFWLLLFFGMLPFLLTAKSVKKESLPTFNCQIVDLIINCSDDANLAIDNWLTASNQSLKASFYC